MTRPSAPSPTLVPVDPAEARRNHFNAIRLAMAMAVIWSHCFALYWGTEENEPVSLLLGGLYNAGSVGVRVFFVISGFLIAQSWLASRSRADYFAKRVKRIYPGFIVATAVCTFVVVPAYASAGWALVTPRAVVEWAWHAVTLHGVIPGADAFADNPGQAVNGALWSIRYEAWCYVGVAVLGILGLMRRPWTVVAVMLGVLAGKAVLDLLGKQPGGGIIEAVFGWPYAWFSLAPCFLVGMLAQFYGRSIPRSGLLMALLAGTLVGTALWGAGSRIAFDILFPFATAYGVFYVAYSRAVNLPDAARFGDFSYGAYLYGFPIQQMVKASFDLSFPVYVATCLVLSLLAGVASWNLVEHWFVRKPRPRAPRGLAAIPGMSPA
ncbi:MAG TPA: acyltransferase [Novosphingobium sp.]|nr:acyltransferase [Novosphingobium sp.]